MMVSADVAQATDGGIATRMLTRHFGDTAALADVELEVPRNAVYLLAGENGAGKTTLMRVLLGLLRPDHGLVEVAGVRSGPGAAVRERIGYVPEHAETPFGGMRVRDLLRYAARFRSSWDAGYEKHLCRELGIDVTRRLSALSKGHLRRVQIVEALAHRPDVLLLDEPTDGLDPVMRDVFVRILIEHITDSPATVIIATHVIHEVEKVAEHVGVLRNGRLITQLSRDDLRASLRRYRMRVPAGFAPGGVEVLRREGVEGDCEWTVRGAEAQVTAALSQAGATAITSMPLPLDEAVITLLRREER